MADLLDFAPVRVLTSNAQPGAGYIARFFQSGTTTPVTVFTDASLGTPWGSSITADAEGKFAGVFSAGGSIKATIETPDGAIVATVDPVQSVPSGSAAASAVSFSPTVALPVTNVQAAIEAAAASAASGFTPFGLGVTGSVDLVANINATNIASGLYRFDGTTTGTYPTGVAAADTGAVRVERETAGSAWMVLYHDTTDRVFYRRMNASTWGAWRENIIADIGATQGDILFRSATAWTRLAAGTSGHVLRTNGAGANPAWVAPTASPYVLLGTIATTSGTSANLSVTLTAYKFLRLVFVGVSGTASINITVDGIQCAQATGSAAATAFGCVEIDLTDGAFWGMVGPQAANSFVYAGDTSYTTATTTITVGCTGGSFDAGSVRVYGVL